jgi:hypothetical protein
VRPTYCCCCCFAAAQCECDKPTNGFAHGLKLDQRSVDNNQFAWLVIACRNSCGITASAIVGDTTTVTSSIWQQLLICLSNGLLIVRQGTVIVQLLQKIFQMSGHSAACRKLHSLK